MKRAVFEGEAHLETLTTALYQGRLLLVWGETPWPPATRPPADRAVTIGRWAREAAGLAPLAWPLADLPPAPILSLDPTDRLAAAFRIAGLSPHVVRGRREVPMTGRHNLLGLGGDLGARRGLLLTWDDVAALRADPDKAHLLAEAARACAGGAVLALVPGEGAVFQRVWETAIAPALREVPTFGLGPWPWPIGITPLGGPPEAFFAALKAASTESVTGDAAAHRDKKPDARGTRDLLTAAFDDEELTSLCSDHFFPVYQNFTVGMSMGQKIQRLLDYCVRHLQMDELLELVQQYNPAQYARFRDLLR
jgi:hypothetical protein